MMDNRCGLKDFQLMGNILNLVRSEFGVHGQGENLAGEHFRNGEVALPIAEYRGHQRLW